MMSLLFLVVCKLINACHWGFKSNHLPSSNSHVLSMLVELLEGTLSKTLWNESPHELLVAFIGGHVKKEQ